MNIENTTEKCEAIVILSAFLGTVTETTTSTILPLQECLSRLNKMKPGSSIGDGLNGKIVKIEGDPNTAIRLFGKPPKTTNTQQDNSDQILKELGEIMHVDRSMSSTSYSQWSPLLIERMKSFAADFEPIAANHQHQSEIASTPPVHKYEKRSKTIRYRSSPLPFLGRSFEKIHIPPSKPTDNVPFLETFRKYLVNQEQCDGVVVDDENAYPIGA